MRIRKLIGGKRGVTLVEIIVGMTVFAIGVLSLTRVMFLSMRSNVRSKHVVVATNLAQQRMEQIISSTRYDNITAAAFPTENYGTIEAGAANYTKFKRIVAIADSTNALGSSIMKEVTVRVEWQDGTVVRNMQIRSSISRFKDINL